MPSLTMTPEEEDCAFEANYNHHQRQMYGSNRYLDNGNMMNHSNSNDYLLQRRRLSVSLDSLATLQLHIHARNSSSSMASTGCQQAGTDYRLCRSVEQILCKQPSTVCVCPKDTEDMFDLCSEFKYPPNKRLEKLISQTSDYASSENSPELFASNPLFEAIFAREPETSLLSSDDLSASTTESTSFGGDNQQEEDQRAESHLLDSLSASNNNEEDLSGGSSYEERAVEEDDPDGFEEKVLSLDSASLWIKSRVKSQLSETTARSSFERFSPENDAAQTSRPLLMSTLSCPSLSTPSITIADYSTTEEAAAEEDECAASSDQVASNNAIFLAITRGLLNSPEASDRRRRFSTYSVWSSNTSLSSLPDDDEESDQWSSSDQTPQSQQSRTSRWKQVRNVVHWSPFVQTYKKQRVPWLQLSGHNGNFKSGGPGTILKRLTGAEEACFLELQTDSLKSLIPKFIRKTIVGNEAYVEMEDLLAKFESPAVMDVKMGIRTYLEDELAKAREKPKLRKDMYEKMVQIDPSVPTEEENRLKAVTKPRYMIWRETISSTATLGFRIEGVKYADGSTSKDFKTTKSEKEIEEAFVKFTSNNQKAIAIYLELLKTLRETLLRSAFFKHHELIGSSLLMIHDEAGANFWMIDFAKTYPLPDGPAITHRDEWKVGNHEDGYLIGVDSLIRIFETLLKRDKTSLAETLVVTK